MKQTLSAVTLPNVTSSDSAGRRTRMREFQSQLMTRMQAAQSGSQQHLNQLGILIGQTHYLLDLREAGEIVTAGSMLKVPLTKDWYLGLANIRGSLTSVVDLARFEGRGATKLDAACRVVAFSSNLAFNSALLVSQVLGLRNSDEMDEDLGQASENLSHKPWILGQFRDRDGKVWSELSLSYLVNDPEFLLIGL